MKAYYLVFYKLYCFFKYIDEIGAGIGFLKWRVLATIQTLQIFVLFILANELSIFYHKNLFPDRSPEVWAIPIAVLLVIFNYYVFIYHKRWKKFENEFSAYSKKKKIRTNIIVILVLIGIVALLIFSFYQYSQIDW